MCGRDDVGRRSRMLCIICGMIVSWVSVQAQQGSVSVRYLPSRGQELREDDCWRISVTSRGDIDQATISIRVEEEQRGVVYQATSGRVRITAGSAVIQVTSLGPILDRRVDSRLNSVLSATGRFPDGAYTICAEINDASGLVLGTACTDVNVVTAQPPILLGPYDGTDVTDDIIVWSWFMQTNVSDGQGIICELRVVEIMPGQSPEEAFRGNPPVIQRKGLITPTWQTNFGSRSFLPGRRYGWRIIATIDERVVSESELWEFTYADRMDAADASSRMDSVVIDANEVDLSRTAGTADVPEVEPEPTEASDEGQPRPVKLTGDTRLTLESASRVGLLSATPQQFARWQVQPTLSVFDVPLSLNLLVTTEENAAQSEIDRGAVLLQNDRRDLRLSMQHAIDDRLAQLERSRLDSLVDSVRTMRDGDTLSFDEERQRLLELRASDPLDQLETLQDLGLASATQTAFADLPVLGFGKVVPAFGAFMLSNVTVNGAVVEYNPDDLYAAASIGKITRETDLGGVDLTPLQTSADIAAPQFLYNTYAGRVGYGRRDGDNVMLSAFYAEDDQQSRILMRIIDSTGSAIAPQQNIITGIRGHLTALDDDLVIDADLNASYFANSTDAQGAGTDARMGFLGDLFGRDRLRAGSTADVAYAVRASYAAFDDDARLSVGTRFVGPGYRSVGTIGLRTDVFRSDVAYEHVLFDRHVRVGLQYSYEEAGYVVRDGNTSIINKVLGSFDLRFPDAPTLSITHTRNAQVQRTVGAEVPFLNDVSTTSLTSSYSRRFGRQRITLFGSATLQENTSDDPLASFKSTILHISQRFTFSAPVSVYTSVSYTQTTDAIETTAPAVTTVDVGGTVGLLEWLETSVGLTLFSAAQASKRSYYADVAATVIERVQLALHVEHNDIDGNTTAPSTFQETVARLITRFAW